MQAYYTVGNLMPLLADDIRLIEQDIGAKLPSDYQQFLELYGYGAISEYFMIHAPDKNYFRESFSDYLYFWELNEGEEVSLLAGIKVAGDIDGDMVLLLSDNKLPFVSVPRHSSELVYFSSFT